MRILQIIATADPRGGGPIEGIRRFSEAWVRQGHSVDLLTLDPLSEKYIIDFPGKIINKGPPHGRSLLKSYRYGQNFVPWLKDNAENYDVVIVNGLWRYQARGTWKGLLGSKTPYFVYSHGMLDPWFRKASPVKHWVKQLSWLFAEGPLLKHARNVLFTCEEEMNLAKNSFWPYHVNGISVGYGALDIVFNAKEQIDAFYSVMPNLTNKRFLLFLSRIHPKKGCDLLLEAFASTADQESDVDLVIAGPDQHGLEIVLKERAQKLGILHRVHFPGMLTGDVKAGAFCAAEAFVLTSHQENFGIVVAEAMSCSTPVLITDKVNIWREVKKDGAGFVGTDTVESATIILQNFFSLSYDEKKLMGKRARDSFLKRFLVENAADNLITVLENEIKGHAL